MYGPALRVHPIWLLKHNTSGHRQHLRDFAKLQAVFYNSNDDKICIYCDKIFLDHLDHYFHECNKYTGTREHFWTLVINICTVELSSYLYNLPDSDLSCVMLGQKPNCSTTESECLNFLVLCSRTWQILTRERELKFY